MFFSFASGLSAQDVKYFLIEEALEIEGQDSFLTFEVYAMSDTGFKLGSGQLYFDYDTSVFGKNVVESNRIEIITDSTSVLGMSLLGSQSSFYNQFVLNDNIDGRFSFNWQSQFSDPCLSEMNVKLYLAKLFQVKILMANPTNQDLSSLVCFQSSGHFEDLTYTTCGPDICDLQDCISYPGFNITQDTFYCDDCRIVTKPSDYEIGSLRFAIQCTPPNDTIFFDITLNNEVIEIESESITVNKNLLIYSENFNRNIEITNRDINNNVPLLIIMQDLKFEGVSVIGKSTPSMILKLEGGTVEYNNAVLDKIDITNN